MALLGGQITDRIKCFGNASLDKNSNVRSVHSSIMIRCTWYLCNNSIFSGSSVFVRIGQEETLQADRLPEALARSRGSCCTEWAPSFAIHSPGPLLWANKAKEFLVRLLQRGRSQANATPVMADQQRSAQCCNVSSRQLRLTKAWESGTETWACAIEDETQWSGKGTCLHEEGHGEIQFPEVHEFFLKEDRQVEPLWTQFFQRIELSLEALSQNRFQGDRENLCKHRLS